MYKKSNHFPLLPHWKLCTIHLTFFLIVIVSNNFLIKFVSFGCNMNMHVRNVKLLGIEFPLYISTLYKSCQRHSTWKYEVLFRIRLVAPTWCLWYLHYIYSSYSQQFMKKAVRFYAILIQRRKTAEHLHNSCFKYRIIKKIVNTFENIY